MNAVLLRPSESEGREIDALALNPDLLNQLMEEMSMDIPPKKDEKLFYPEKFEAK
jgi:hypothetical protein